jgi:hypothetical protein
LGKPEEIDMSEEQTKKYQVPKLCPICKGTGLDKSAHHRYTTGGHDDRSCPRCDGECFIENRFQESEEEDGEYSGPKLEGSIEKEWKFMR